MKKIIIAQVIALLATFNFAESQKDDKVKFPSDSAAGTTPKTRAVIARKEGNKNIKRIKSKLILKIPRDYKVSRGVWA